MFGVDPPYGEKARFIVSFCRDLQQHRIALKTLRVNKIHAMLQTIGFTTTGSSF
ncbi:hypothetical protein BLL52_2907 [Rhodoferax antarcticus ANT.BR]|uniref:Uncharacterized protein n=1 Tax=Rhodoferax antarcticus ANT.BR TaxID=1111071 RepID=A0A1Q8YFH9_9BURK|nr:hypothetical protein BLL52_2907 [Rhodoferax antarcticus ANT.BR]